MKNIKFYIRLRFGKWINYCIVFSEFNKPTIQTASTIRSNYDFIEINL